MDFFSELFVAVWYILPAYLANSSAVVLGGGTPLDLGGFYLDGKRIFGDGKTIRGFFGGILAGVLTASVQGYYGRTNALQMGFLLSLGAMLGDLVKSFFKRRIGFATGKQLVPWDQVDFLIGAFLLGSLVEPPGLNTILILVFLTPLTHISANWAAYRLGLKKVPW